MSASRQKKVVNGRRSRSRSGPAPAKVEGPLAGYEPVLRAELAEMGYASATVRDVVAAMRRLSAWMERHRVAAAGLTPSRVEEFLAERRHVTSVELVARRGLGPLLRFLRSRELIPRGDGVGGSPVEALLVDYRDWLVEQRGLAGETVRCYLVQGRKLLDWLDEPLPDSLRRLDAAAVVAFIMAQARRCTSVWSAKTLVTATRSLLRFLHVEGLVAVRLADAVPNVAGWRLAALPKGLPREQVEAVLAAPNVATAAGLRDRAVLLVLARLGLRGAEAAALGLADVDWRAGQLLVRGKGARTEAVPLPAEVGQAMVDYLTAGRPACSCRSLFVTARPPYRPLSPATVRAIMGRACQGAGLPRLGAHRLRHSLATDLLRAGAPLAEVGQLLRHRSQLSTTIYAKVDYGRLRSLARPWPLPVSSGRVS